MRRRRPTERALGFAAARGDAEARRRLIEGHLRLVVTIARKHLGHGLLLADLTRGAAQVLYRTRCVLRRVPAELTASDGAWQWKGDERDPR